MATLTTTTATATQQPSVGLSLDFLPNIDMTTLSQSELRSLSLCSSSTNTTTANIDNATMFIDRSNFNESAGSRRQTYSRPSHHHHRHRLAAPLPKKTPASPDPPPSSSSENPENRSIINFLKHLLSSDPDFQQPPDLSEFEMFNHHLNVNTNSNTNTNNSNNWTTIATNAEGPVRKRKRGRKAKVKLLVTAEERERAMGVGLTNKNGVLVDLDRLAGLEDPFKEELMKRTLGMENEEQLFGFLRELDGQWCSRRRKRKFVDASEFGDVLPVGWKIILGLKRKEGHAWVYCRRYVSPGGQHFVSCKEVSAYLQSFLGSSDQKQLKVYAGDNTGKKGGVASESLSAGAIEKVEEDHRQANVREKEVSLLGMDNLAEVQIRDLFECHKCMLSFDEKDTYLQHLLSFHQKTTRRYKIGSTVGDGVIVKDGKFECQFCHKVFHERRRYNGHVGIHVRNYVRGIEESPEVRMALENISDPGTMNEVPSRISKMDALLEIAQSSIQHTSTAGHNDETSSGLNFDNRIVVSNPEAAAVFSDHELNSDSPVSEPDLDNDMIDEPLEDELEEQPGDLMVIDGKMEKINDGGILIGAKMDSSTEMQHGDASENVGVKDGLAHSSGEIEEFGAKGERGSESQSLAPFLNMELSNIGINMNVVAAERSHLLKLDELDNMTNVEVEIGFGIHSSLVNSKFVQQTVDQLFEESVPEHEVPEAPMLQLQSSLEPSLDVSTHNKILDKEEDDFGSTDHRHDKVTGFEELRLEEIDKLKFGFGAVQEPSSLPEVPLNDEIQGAYGTSGQFETQVMVDTSAEQQLTTVCVWCGEEFSHEAVDAEMQSDSVGYMCPSCKAKISGQYVLGSGC